MAMGQEKTPGQKKRPGQKKTQRLVSRLRKQQRGVAMLETLIAFFVLAIGLMGLATLQMKSLQFNQGAYHRSQATIAANDILDRMRINRKQAQSNAYDIDYGSSGGGAGIAKQDLTEWVQFLGDNLPEGEGSISCDADDVCVIKIRWRDRFSTDATDWEEFSIASQM